DPGPPSSTTRESDDTRPGASDVTRSVTATVFTGDDTLGVVGESYFQEALWVIFGGRSQADVRHPVIAVLVPQPDNPYDENAISVQIEGQLVGDLSRDQVITDC